jgi:hypothetical protein
MAHFTKSLRSSQRQIQELDLWATSMEPPYYFKANTRKGLETQGSASSIRLKMPLCHFNIPLHTYADSFPIHQLHLFKSSSHSFRTLIIHTPFLNTFITNFSLPIYFPRSLTIIRRWRRTLSIWRRRTLSNWRWWRLSIRLRWGDC